MDEMAFDFPPLLIQSSMTKKKKKQKHNREGKGKRFGATMVLRKKTTTYIQAGDSSKHLTLVALRGDGVSG